MSRYMMDAHILYFYASRRRELTAEVRDILDDYGNRIYIPSKCVEELIYHQQSGKIDIAEWKDAESIIDFIKDSNFGIKYVAEEHLRTLAKLPLYGDHKDVTDRIAIAQSITEKIPLISSDRKFHYYKKHGLRLVFNTR
jgi:PIN domain nuclease of toxin-antitoxin system